MNIKKDDLLAIPVNNRKVNCLVSISLISLDMANIICSIQSAGKNRSEFVQFRSIRGPHLTIY